MTFGERLRNARKERNLTQRQLAEASGISINAIHNYENDKVDPTLFNVSCVCLALGVSLDYLALGKGSDDECI